MEIGADARVTAGICDVVRWPIIAEELAIAFAHSSALTRPEVSCNVNRLRALSTC
jgi:hypothetical protein